MVFQADPCEASGDVQVASGSEQRMTLQRVATIAFLGAMLTFAGIATIGSGMPRWLISKVRKYVEHVGKRSDTERHLTRVGAMRAPLVPETNIGIHLSSPSSTESFANLAMGSAWTVMLPGQRGTPLPMENIDQNGDIRMVPAGSVVMRYLTPPGGGIGATSIRCTYSGKANVEVAGPSVAQTYNRPNDLQVSWIVSKYPASLNIRGMDPQHPIRDIDCRNSQTPRSARFAPRFLEMIKGFKVLRFMDWQNTNADASVTWASRHTVKSLAIGTADGASIEDMVSLARMNKSGAWFNMPSQADDDYIRRFAQYAHDNLPVDSTVYVELGNEVWNWGFPVSRHIMQEGIEARMGGSAKEAISFRYAERLIHVMDIWADVFRDNPRRLVRVASGQSGDPYRSGLILGYKDLPKHVDAFATAPYFDYDKGDGSADLTEIFRRIDVGIEASLRDAEVQKAMATKHGLRFIAYEAGQGIVLPDLALNEQIQRDKRMYTAYRRYIDGWRRRVGDTIILFGTVFRTRSSGAWGLVEYEGQPVADAPKYRAVRDELVL